MSEEWSIDWDVVDEKLQVILEELKAEGKTEVDQDTEAFVRERLSAAIALPSTVTLFPIYVTVHIFNGSVKITTVITGTKHFEGTIDKTHWGAASSGWMTISEGGDVDFTALNTEGVGRPGNFQMRFYKNSRTQVAHVEGSELYQRTERATGKGVLYE
ncbi:hypothetical protein PHLGIDRAFT_18168 [Phlebiopsis gigantea 11061_1 CR5-6]|uniref:Uncharacterized protein n=1 Tax=Phlebiopsis gigantea (strain 11061_1 CR5-6) TaxID=745531 RepID=A0A0C3NZM6_PHLG1|nr:hypothetical protein PHLGIDRAFT_18168 [Phlebiopsis gigantea 11061_1 CR5-6]